MQAWMPLLQTFTKTGDCYNKNSPNINSDWQEMTVAFRSIQSGDMAGLHAYIQSKLPPKAIEQEQTRCNRSISEKAPVKGKKSPK
jgi:hypothetical protein